MWVETDTGGLVNLDRFARVRVGEVGGVYVYAIDVAAGEARLTRECATREQAEDRLRWLVEAIEYADRHGHRVVRNGAWTTPQAPEPYEPARIPGVRSFGEQP